MEGSWEMSWEKRKQEGVEGVCNAGSGGGRELHALSTSLGKVGVSSQSLSEVFTAWRSP